MNITEVSELTGIEVALLRHMRARESITFHSGPPYCKTLSPKGDTLYVYKKTEVLNWIKRRRFRVTAGDAAKILGISRMELLRVYRHSLHSWEDPKGKLVINVARNIFIWVPRIAIQNH